MTPRATADERRDRREIVRARLDDASERALAVLMRKGRNESEAVRAAPATFRPDINVRGERTCVLVEQLRAVDVGRLGDFVGHVTAVEQQTIDDALTLVLDL